MKSNINNVICISIGVVFLVLFFAYGLFDQEWAKLPFYLLLTGFILYNFYNLLKIKKNKMLDKD